MVDAVNAAWAATGRPAGPKLRLLPWNSLSTTCVRWLERRTDACCWAST